MSKKKKKVVVSTNKSTSKDKKKLIAPTVSKTRSAPQQQTAVRNSSEPLLFEKKHYLLMGVGVGLIALGMILMLGGHMPDPNTWDPDIIYSARRTIVAPIFILAGLILQIVAIFRK